MAWTIDFTRSAERDLAPFDQVAAERVLTLLRHRISPPDDPRVIGEALSGSKRGGFWTYRVGDFRVIASIEDSPVRIHVDRNGNRREVYR